MKLRKIYLIICLIVISCFVLTCSSCKKEEEECINLMELWTNNKGLVKEHYKRANYVNPRYFPKIKLEEYYGQTLKKSLGVNLKGVLVFKTSAADSDRIFIYECYSHKAAVNAF